MTGNVDNSSSFSVGDSDGEASFGGDIAYAALWFSGEANDIAEAQLSALHAFLGLGETV